MKNIIILFLFFISFNSSSFAQGTSSNTNLYDTKTKYHSSDNYYIVEKNGKKGIINLNNKILLPIEYQNITKANCRYLAIEKNGKKGIYNLQNHKILLNAQYDDIIFGGYTDAENYHILNNGKKYLNVYQDGLLEVDSYHYIKIMGGTNGRKHWDYLSTGERIEDNYNTTPRSNVIFHKNNKIGLIQNGEITLPAEYDSIRFASGGNKFIVEKNKKKGVLSKTETIAPIIYDDIESLDYCFILNKDNKKALLCNKKASELKYDSIKSIESFSKKDYSNLYEDYVKYFITEANGKKGLYAKITSNDKPSGFFKIFDTKYDDIKTYENKFIIKNDEKYAIATITQLKNPKFKYDNVEVDSIIDKHFLKVKKSIVSYPAEPLKAAIAAAQAPFKGFFIGLFWLFLH